MVCVFPTVMSGQWLTCRCVQRRSGLSRRPGWTSSSRFATDRVHRAWELQPVLSPVQRTEHLCRCCSGLLRLLRELFPMPCLITPLSPRSSWQPILRPRSFSESRYSVSIAIFSVFCTTKTLRPQSTLDSRPSLPFPLKPTATPRTCGTAPAPRSGRGCTGTWTRSRKQTASARTSRAGAP